MMIRSLCKIPQKIASQMAVDVLSRNMSTQPLRKMEDYFQGKKIIVTGSCAGQSRGIFSLRILTRKTLIFFKKPREKCFG